MKKKVVKQKVINLWNWCLVVASVTAAFWFGPLTPFFPLCIALTLSIKKVMQIKNRRRGEK